MHNAFELFHCTLSGITPKHEREINIGITGNVYIKHWPNLKGRACLVFCQTPLVRFPLCYLTALLLLLLFASDVV